MAVDIGDGSTDDNATNDPVTTPPFSASTKPWENPQSLVGSLLQKTASRAVRTLSTSAYPSEDENVASGEKDDTSTNASIENVLDATIARASSRLDGNDILDGSLISNSDANIGTRPTTTPTRQHQDKRTYLGNPSVTPTALAHSLWQSSIVPHRDTVIDATCGNGKDCLALARMLFPDTGIDERGGEEDATPQLIGIDIQSRAVQNTKRSLLASLPSDLYYDNVLILEQSHEHLLGVPRESGSVGLVCYNLGYLPGAPPADQPSIPSDYKACQTQTETTLHSITDASLLLRVGGLLSVMTYPGSNLEESLAVEHFAEGLAMLTTRDVGGWRGYADRIPDYDDEGRVRTLVTQALERVVAEGPEKQTWRVFTHKPLGRPLSPVLVTAMRIK